MAQLTLDGDVSDPKLRWVDYTRRNDPATPYWVGHLTKTLKSRGYPRVLCFWTKAPAAVAELYKDAVKDLRDHGTLVLAQVTYNGYKELEPGITEERSDLAPLVALLGPECVRLRFDPIIVGYTRPEHFERCLSAAVRFGIKRIAVNFILMHYRKLKGVMEPYKIIEKPSPEEKVRILKGFVAKAKAVGVELSSCAELNAEKIPERVPGLIQAACADPEWAVSLNPSLKGIFKPRASRDGCLCVYSDDWGSYPSKGGPKCIHQCIYCYAK